MKDFIESHFDKILLLLLVLIFGLPAAFNRGNVDFSQRLVDGFQGALLTLITQAIVKKNDPTPKV